MKTKDVTLGAKDSRCERNSSPLNTVRGTGKFQADFEDITSVCTSGKHRLVQQDLKFQPHIVFRSQCKGARWLP